MDNPNPANNFGDQMHNY